MRRKAKTLRMQSGRQATLLAISSVAAAVMAFTPSSFSVAQQPPEPPPTEHMTPPSQPPSTEHMTPPSQPPSTEHTTPQPTQQCPRWLVIEALGVVPPSGSPELGLFFDSIVKKTQDLHGNGQVGVMRLEYKRPKYEQVFQDKKVKAALTAATGNPQPQGQPLPTGRDKLPDALLAGRDDGVKKGLVQLRLQAARCPNQHFILTGQSLGAWVLGDILPELEEIYPRIDAVLLSGDPKFDSSSPAAARRPDQSGPPRTVGLAARALGPRVPYLPQALSNRSQSYCLDIPLDPICATPQPDVLTGKDWATAFRACTPADVGLKAIATAISQCGHVDYLGLYAATFLGQPKKPVEAPTPPRRNIG
ncbi:cutinase family protein [Streptomyces sparsogenes]|uniref:cutinase family protein n=1 Tax=Streptomyces sparsogenes TaxID=67365 RepID=UPI00340647EA